jgi:DNA polymerase III psi subunit
MTSKILKRRQSVVYYHDRDRKSRSFDPSVYLQTLGIAQWTMNDQSGCASFDRRLQMIMRIVNVADEREKQKALQVYPSVGSNASKNQVIQSATTDKFKSTIHCCGRLLNRKTPFSH